MQNKITFTGDGQQNEFHFNFRYFQPTDVRVYIDGNLVATANYAVLPTLSMPDYPDSVTNPGIIGGTVVFAIAPELDTKINIIRKIALERVIDYQPTAKINPTDLNTDFDFILEYLKDLSDLGIDIDEIRGMICKITDLKEEILASDFGDIIDTQIIQGQITDILAQLQTMEAMATNINSNTNLISGINSLLGNIDYVIESGATSNTWYRKYRSGRVEQGGKSPGNSTVSGTTINLPIPMINSDYTIQLTSTHPGNTLTAAAKVIDGSVTNTLFKVLTNYTDGTTSGFTSYGFYWEAKGQTAIS